MEDLPLIEIEHSSNSWAPVNPHRKPVGYEAFNFDNGIPQTDKIFIPQFYSANKQSKQAKGNTDHGFTIASDDESSTVKVKVKKGKMGQKEYQNHSNKPENVTSKLRKKGKMDQV